VPAGRLSSSHPILELSDYRLLEKLGSGGAGTVYRAWQVSRQRYVAIKLVETGGVDAERFEREVRLAAGLTHPHIVPIEEVSQHEGRRYLVMRLIEGQSLDRARVEPRQAMVLMCQVVNAIAYAHRSGVVHRDLKPHNLILERGGDHVWVTDFGIARPLAGGATLTAHGNVVGTPAYMPPEQARGGTCDERSDVYSLGATLYELLTGRAPFEDSDLLTVVRKVLSVDPPPPRRLNPRLPVEADLIVGKAMDKDPAARYQSASALEEDLRRYLAGETILARAPGVVRRVTTLVRRHPLASSLVSFVFTLVAVLLVSGFIHTAGIKRQLAMTMMAEANALGAAGQWQDARARYQEAAAALRRVGISSVGPELGLLDAHHQAPPPLLTLEGHGAAVRAVVFLPDGKRALSASDDGTLRLWDVPRGRTIRVLSGHEGPVLTVAVSADGRRAVSGGQDGTVRVWDVAGTQPAATMHAHGVEVLKVALSPDGRRALSRTADGTIELWDLATLRVERTLHSAPKRVVGLAFSPDGRRAMTARNIESKGESLNSRASLWEVDSGREVQTIGAFSAEVESISFSPDGHRLLTGGYDRLVSLWDLDTGRRLLTLKGHRHGVMGVAFSLANRVIISGSQDQTVKLWDAADGNLVRSFDTGDAALGVAVSPDGRFILTGGHDSTLKLWDLGVGHEARSFWGHESAVLSTAVSADGRLAFSGGQDRRIRAWDTATGQEVRTFDHGGGVHALAVSRDGRLLASGGTGSRIRIWDLYAGTLLREVKGNVGAVRGLEFSPDGGRLLSGTESGEVRLWEVATGRELHYWNQLREVRSVAYAEDGHLVMAASFGGTARVWDTATGRIVRELRPTPAERISAVTMSRDGRLAATGDDTRLVHLWDLADGTLVRTLSGHVGDLRAVRFSPDGSLLLTASRDGTVRAWDVASGRALHTFAWTPDAIRSFATSRDGRFAMAGSDDGSLAVWDFTQIRAELAMEEKLAATRAILEGTPDDGKALVALAQWYAFRGVSGWCIDLSRQARASGAATSALTLARCLWREGDPAAARQELTRALAGGEAPADYLRLLIRDLGSSDQSGRLNQLNARDGRVRLSFLGIRSGETRVGATSPEQASGALVNHIFDGSAADQAGLRAGDLIVALDGQRLESDVQLGRTLASRSAGAPVKLTFLRAGVTRTVEATLGERPGRLWQREPDSLPEPTGGYTLQTLRAPLAKAFGLDPNTQGAVVIELSGQFISTIPSRLAVEDVIVKVGSKPISNAEEAVAALGALPLDAWNRVELIRPGAVR
jgi:WD40 repeat protein